MSDPEVPQPEQPHDVEDVVDSAKAGLADAEKAAAEVTGAADADAPVEDPDAAAFAEAEKAFPGTFSASAAADSASRIDDASADGAPAETSVSGDAAPEAAAPSEPSEVLAAEPEVVAAPLGDDTPTTVVDPAPEVATAAYASTIAHDAETQVVPAEPIVPPAPQPIFVQAPEPPRELGNRGSAGAIGLLAALAFAVLYFGAIIGFGALDGKVTGENIVDSLVKPLTTWSFWVPVVVFYLGFWLLGAFINRGRWGYWVVFGLLVGGAAYGGHLLGQLFQAPFWQLSASQGNELVQGQLLAPLAIAALVIGREVTIWFGAWVARSGARKTALNDEARLEYERTLEAGPSLAR